MTNTKRNRNRNFRTVTILGSIMSTCVVAGVSRRISIAVSMKDLEELSGVELPVRAEVTFIKPTHEL